MITIDGSMGEGGGQLVRSSLALALVSGRSVVIENIRARRSKPGLRRQHLTAVRAAVAVGRAACEGAELGSARLEFHPGGVDSGDFHWDVGSAGSTTLVVQTVLPALMLASGPSQLTLEGGTHNPLAPPYEFLGRCYLPLVERMGPRFQLQLERPGFFPAGGGRLAVHVRPVADLHPLELPERGPLRSRRLRCLLAHLPRHIAERELDTFRRLSGWKSGELEVDQADASLGPGNVLLAELAYEHVTEVFCAFGKRGLPAEKVARQLYREVREYQQVDAPVGSHLADQLLLPLAVAADRHQQAGSFRTVALTDHTTTHIELLKRFLGVKIQVRHLGDRGFQITVGESPAA